MSGEVDSDRDEGAECNGVCTRRGGKLATQLERGKNSCSTNKEKRTQKKKKKKKKKKTFQTFGLVIPAGIVVPHRNLLPCPLLFLLLHPPHLFL